MIPGEMRVAPGEIELNAGRATVTIENDTGPNPGNTDPAVVCFRRLGFPRHTDASQEVVPRRGAFGDQLRGDRITA